MRRVIDLCCGRGGWSLGFLASGWSAWGFDVQNHGYPGELVLQDARTIDGRRLRGRGNLIVASPPCHEFSYRDLAWGRVRDLPAPDLSIVQACFRIAREAELPIVLENVRGLERWYGPAVAHYGAFYLWGDVPPLLPWVEQRARLKGMELGRVGRPARSGPAAVHSGGDRRRDWTMDAARVPTALGRHLAECFG